MSVIDLNRTMFFKTRFDVESLRDDILWDIVMLLKQWVDNKARRLGYEVTRDLGEWTKLKNGGMIDAAGADVSLRSCAHFDNQACTWACEFVENVDLNDGTAPRQWVTELGFKGETKTKGTFSLVLSYRDRPGFIGPLQEMPDGSVPNIVKFIQQDPQIRCYVSGTNVKTTLVTLDRENCEELYNEITRSDRELPVVLVCGRRDGSAPVDPNILAGMLSANALVVFAPDSDALLSLNKELSRVDYGCYPGAIRVYASRPHPERPGDTLRHRYISSTAAAELGECGITACLRRAICQDVSFWQEMLRIEDVRGMNRESSRQKYIETLKAKYQDEALDEMLKLDEENAGLRTELDSMRMRCRAAEDDLKAVKAKCEAFELALSSKGRSATDNELRDFLACFKRPTCFLIGKLITLVFPDRIDFSERGWKSLDVCKTSPIVLWEALRDMCEILYPILTSSNGVDAPKRFNSSSRFTYSRGEGPTTHANKQQMAQRKDEYRGKTISIEPHIKSRGGNPSSDKFLRIYFAFDGGSNKLVVGDCGGHLDNATTRHIK